MNVSNQHPVANIPKSTLGSALKGVLRPVFVIFSALTVFTGVIYPAIVTAVSHVAFTKQADGSLIVRDGKAIGSSLIGQQFDAPNYFWGRLSATAPQPYNATSSAGSNLGPTNPALLDEVKGRIAALHAADPDNTTEIPVDLVTSSASGLDPEISPAAAAYQVQRVAKARGLAPDAVTVLIAQNTQGRQLGLLGEPRVNVLTLNLALDAAQADTKPAH